MAVRLGTSFEISQYGQRTELAGLQPSLVATFGYHDFIEEGTDWEPRHELILRPLFPVKSLLHIPSNYEA